ncbi:uncharacterized protein LOC143208191 [Lasioglossum baleicum]|uniref:uncharacterized protein LOC143208191 n=1 Tax=Lasioglossum baleicum TaxID=434251 RepID=UPI003FCE714D
MDLVDRDRRVENGNRAECPRPWVYPRRDDRLDGVRPAQSFALPRATWRPNEREREREITRSKERERSMGVPWCWAKTGRWKSVARRSCALLRGLGDQSDPDKGQHGRRAAAVSVPVVSLCIFHGVHDDFPVNLPRDDTANWTSTVVRDHGFQDHARETNVEAVRVSRTYHLPFSKLLDLLEVGFVAPEIM